MFTSLALKRAAHVFSLRGGQYKEQSVVYSFYPLILRGAIMKTYRFYAILLLTLFPVFVAGQDAIVSDEMKIKGIKDQNMVIESARVAENTFVHFTTSGGSSNDDDFVIYSAVVDQSPLLDGGNLPEKVRFRKFYKAKGGITSLVAVSLYSDVEPAADSGYSGILFFVETPGNNLFFGIREAVFRAIPFNVKGKQDGNSVEIAEVSAELQETIVDPVIRANLFDDEIGIAFSYNMQVNYTNPESNAYVFLARMDSQGALAEEPASLKLLDKGRMQKVKAAAPGMLKGRWLIPVSAVAYSIDTSPFAQLAADGHSLSVISVREKPKGLRSKAKLLDFNEDDDGNYSYRSLTLLPESLEVQPTAANTIRLFAWTHSGDQDEATDGYQIWKVKKNGKGKLESSGDFGIEAPDQEFADAPRELIVHNPLIQPDGSAVLPVNARWTKDAQVDSTISIDTQHVLSQIAYYLLIRYEIIKPYVPGKAGKFSGILGFPNLKQALLVKTAVERGVLSEKDIKLVLAMIFVANLFADLHY